MPVLRIGGTPSLGEAFNPLMEGLGAAWDPKTRAEAFMLQQRIMLQNMAIAQERRKQQAQQAAISSFGAQLPDQASRDIVTNAIYSGASPDEVTKLVARYGNHQPIDRLDRDATLYNEQLWNDLHPNAPWDKTYPPPLSPFLEENAKKSEAAQAGATTQAQKQGEVNVMGYPITEPRYFPQGIPGQRTMTMPQNPTSPQPAQPVQPPQPAQPSQPQQPSSPVPASPATPDITVPNPAAPGYSPETPVVRNIPGGGQVLGPTPAEVEAQKATTSANATMLRQAYDEGNSAARLKNTLGQLRDLATIVNSGGVGGQVQAAVLKRLSDAGIVVTNAGEAQKAMDQLLNSEIPQLRKDSGIQRLAGPEIQAVGKQIGSAQLPPAVLNNIIANEEAAADIQIARAKNAGNVLGWGDTQMNMPQYVQANNDLNAQLKQHTDQLRTQYSAIGTQPTAVAGAKPPPAPIGTIDVPAPAPAPAPAVGVPAAVAAPAPVPAPAPAPQPETPAPSVPPAQTSPSPRPKIWTLGPDGKLQEMLQ